MRNASVYCLLLRKIIDKISTRKEKLFWTQEQTDVITGKQIRHLRTQAGMTQEEDWSEADYISLVQHLRNTISMGGVVLGAFIFETAQFTD